MIRIYFNIVLVFGIVSIGFTQKETLQEKYFTALSDYKQDNFSQALLSLKGEDHDAFIKLRADIYFKLGNYSSAIQEYNNLIKHNAPEAYYGLSKTYAIMGYEIESMHYLEKHFEYRNPRSMAEIDMEPAFHTITNTSEWRKFWRKSRYSSNQQKLQEANYLINQGKNTEALNILYQIQRGYSASQSNYLLSQAYYNMNDKQNAGVYINEALRRDRNNIDYLEHKTKLLFEAKNDSEALTTVNKLMELNKFNPDYLVLKARIENNLGNYSVAINKLEFFLRFFPDSEDETYYLAVVYANNEQLTDAIKCYNKLIDLNPSKTKYFIGRGDIYYYFEQWDFALQDYSMALDIDPFQPDVHYHLGWSRYKMNSSSKACRSWHHAKRMGHRKAAKTIIRKCR